MPKFTKYPLLSASLRFFLRISGFVIVFVASCNFHKPPQQQATIASPIPTGTTEANVLPTATPLPELPVNETSEANILPTATPLPEVPANRSDSEIIVCVDNEPQTLYPFATNLYAEELVLGAIYDGPIDKHGYQYEPVILTGLPTLANGGVQTQTVSVQDGDMVFDGSTNSLGQHQGPPITMTQLVVTFTLRSDLRWSNGHPLTAMDSVYAFEVLSDPNTPGDKPQVRFTSDYQVVGEFEIQWKGVPGYMTHDYLEFFVTPLPKHQLQLFTAEELLTLIQATRYPLSWGPFMVSEWVNGDHLTLTRNPYYFRQPYPLVDKLTFRFGDFLGIVLGLTFEPSKRYRCDIVIVHSYNDPAGGEVLVDDLIDAGLIEPYIYPIAWEHIDFVSKNQLDPESPLNNPLFRQAILRVIDPTQMTPQMRFQEIDGLIAANHPLATQLHFNEAYPYDPAMAQALLDSLGIVDRDGDGFREQNSNLLTLRLAYIPSTTAEFSVIPVIRSQLEEIGLMVEPIPLYHTQFQALVNGRLEIDLIHYPSPITMFPLCDLYRTANISLVDFEMVGLFETLFPTTFAPVTGYSNSDYDQACQIAQETISFDELGLAYEQVYDILRLDLPTIPLAVSTTFAFARPEIGGFSPDGLQVETWNVENWFIK